MNFECLDNFLNIIKYLDADSKKYIWGICIYGDLLGRLFNEYGIQWDGYYDNYNNVKKNGKLNDKTVYKANEVDILDNAYYVLTMRNYEPVRRQLLDQGVDLEHIFYFGNIKVLDNIQDILKDDFVNEDKLKLFHNIHDGQKCFIVGNGPSLCIEDLNEIHKSGIISLACNLIFKCYDKTQWRPRYYFFTDGVGIRETFTDNNVLSYVSKNCQYIFSRSNGDLAKYVNCIDNLMLFKYVFSDSEDIFSFSSDCSREVYIGHTVTYAMLQIAVYMGFKEIYLIGMDHSFSMERTKDGNVTKRENIHNHAAILGSYGLWGIAEPMKTTNAYISAKNYADTHGIKIYNATRGGNLEVFERVVFDELFL